MGKYKVSSWFCLAPAPPAPRPWAQPRSETPQLKRRESQMREGEEGRREGLSLIHISEPTRPRLI
eukprot:759794-Rhodomonas_salina.1